MNKINPAPLTRFRNDQHLILMNKTKYFISQETALKLDIVVLDGQFTISVADETAAIAVEEGSKFTKKMNLKAIERKDLMDGFDHILEAGKRHYDPNIKDSTEHLLRIKNKYSKINKKSKAEKTLQIHNYCGELLNAENLPFLTTLKEVEWITRLQTLNGEVDTFFVSRNDEESNRISGDVRASRAITDPIYLAITERINAQVTMFGDTEYLRFINQLNGIIEDLKRNLNSQKGKGNNPDTPVTPAT